MLTRVRNLPKLPDLLHRSRIPDELESAATIGAEADPGDLGLPPDYAERIWRRMRLVYRSGVHPAIQVCVRRHGTVVFDRAHGNGPDDAPETPKVLATPSTPFVTYSASKGVTAFVVHLLAERGLLDLHAPVCRYIPECGCHGKESITVGQVLAHRSGVANLPREALTAEAVEIGNDPAYLGLVAPSANVVSTANELSRCYEIFRRGGELDGVRVLRPETIAAALAPQSRIEPDLSLGMNFGFGYGPMLGGRVVSLYGPDTRRRSRPTDLARTWVARRGRTNSKDNTTAGRRRNYRGARIRPEFAERRNRSLKKKEFRC